MINIKNYSNIIEIFKINIKQAFLFNILFKNMKIFIN